MLPIQNDKPATVFIFGAGASYADGVPLQADILPQIVRDEDPQLKLSETAKRLRNFLTAYFAHGEQAPSLKEVFGFIEFFIKNDLSLSKQWWVDSSSKRPSRVVRFELESAAPERRR